MRPILVAHAPTRLDFGGGWTDVPPYPEERGGFVCNIAIEKRATVRLTHSANERRGEALHDNSTLVRAACTSARVTDANVRISSDFPVGAGLGGSSAAGVALAAALAKWTNRVHSAAELAEWSREVEVAGMGMAGGRQDHYAAAYGGALALTFAEQVHVRQLALSETTARELERRVLLVYTGESRISGETITAVLDAYKERVPRVTHALERMKRLAIDMASALESDDITTLGALVGEHWKFQRALHPKITTERIDAIADAAHAAGALGLKALGASGGGCVMIIAAADGVDEVRESIATLGELLPWKVAHDGVRVREELPLPPRG